MTYYTPHEPKVEDSDTPRLTDRTSSSKQAPHLPKLEKTENWTQTTPRSSCGSDYTEDTEDVGVLVERSTDQTPLPAEQSVPATPSVDDVQLRIGRTPTPHQTKRPYETGKPAAENTGKFISGYMGKPAAKQKLTPTFSRSKTDIPPRPRPRPHAAVAAQRRPLPTTVTSAYDVHTLSTIQVQDAQQLTIAGDATGTPRENSFVAAREAISTVSTANLHRRHLSAPPIKAPSVRPRPQTQQAPHSRRCDACTVESVRLQVC